MFKSSSSFVLSLQRTIPAFFPAKSTQGLWEPTSCQPRLKGRMAETTVCKQSNAGLECEKAITRKRKVIEHLVVFQMKEGLTEDQEKDMLDHLYTLQYQLRGILTVSLGSNIANENMNGCTHGLFMRFPSKEALGGYYESPARWRVEHDYIFPYYNGMICIDYEAEVEDDIEPIFRRGEVFEEGVESLMLLQVKPDVDPSKVKEGLNSVSHLVDELGTLVVQHTSGVNIGELGKGYTHGMVTRFLSEEARDIFMQHPHYVEIVETKLKPNFLKMLTVEFNVAPVGTTAL